MNSQSFPRRLLKGNAKLGDLVYFHTLVFSKMETFSFVCSVFTCPWVAPGHEKMSQTLHPHSYEGWRDSSAEFAHVHLRGISFFFF